MSLLGLCQIAFHCGIFSESFRALYSEQVLGIIFLHPPMRLLCEPPILLSITSHRPCMASPIKHTSPSPWKGHWSPLGGIISSLVKSSHSSFFLLLAVNPISATKYLGAQCLWADMLFYTSFALEVSTVKLRRELKVCVFFSSHSSCKCKYFILKRAEQQTEGSC